MGFFDGVKSKLGFGGQPEWQDDGFQNEYDNQGFDPQDNVDGQYADQGYGDYDQGYENQSSVLDFDTYNPSKFGSVTLNTDHDIEVASYDGDTSDSYFGRRESYAASIGTSSSRSSSSNVRSFRDRPERSERSERSKTEHNSSASVSTWDTPSDPSFLDDAGSSSLRSASEILSHAHRKPEDHLSIVNIKSYADVEGVASALRGGSTAVLVLKGTRSELAKRALDFSFGVASALNGTVDKQADKVYIISRDGKALTDEETEYLTNQGVL